MIGTTLGHFRITAKIGAGGMGEVYRARDERLDRDVAIKVLPEEVAGDPERFARFEREAKLLASLNHPHIATLYGLEHFDAPADAGAERASPPRYVLVMELVEGEDLASYIGRGPLPVDDSVAIARQIAEALEHAHGAGIIHRDLKPANIALDREGSVKVLDFGLAKALVDEPSGDTDLTHSPTVAGTLLGTAAYMSPEQARGKRVDQRTDIWALGCVLFEMLTGCRAFAGETASDTIANVLQQAPEWIALPAATPDDIHRLLRRCMAKDPHQRLHSVADARLELEQAGIESAGFEQMRSEAAPPAHRPYLRALPWVVAVVGVGLALWSTLADRAASQAPSVIAVRALTDQPNVVGLPSLSPDGGTVAFEAGEWPNTDIFVQRVGGRRAVNLTEECGEGDSMPAFSPDGEHIAYHSECGGGGLFVMGATGESTRRVTDFGYFPAWSPDGRRLVFALEAMFDRMWQTGGSDLWVVDLAGGEPRRIFVGNASLPQWSPNGKWIAYEASGEGSNREVWVIPADGLGETEAPVRVTADPAGDFNPQWSPDGRSLYFASDRMGAPNLWRVAFEETFGRPAGEPEPVTLPLPCGGFSFSRDGRRLALGWSVEQSSLQRLDLDPTTGARRGEPRTILESTLIFEQVSVSPDNQWIAGRLLPDRDLFVVRADGTGLRRLTQDPFDDQTPAWSPDGSAVVFSSDRGNGNALWSIRLDGSELRRLTPEDTDCAAWPFWSPDGRLLATSQSKTCLWEVGPSGVLGSFEVLPAPSRDHVFWPSWWSADGRRVLGASMVAGGTYSGATIGFDVETREYLRYPLLDGIWACASLGDGRPQVCSAEGGGAIVAVDVHAGTRTVILSAAEGRDLESWAAAPSHEWLCLVRRHKLREIWLAELE